MSLPTENKLETLQPTSKTKARMVKTNARSAGGTGHIKRAGTGHRDQTLHSCDFSFLLERLNIKLRSKASISGYRLLLWALGFKSQEMFDWVCFVHVKLLLSCLTLCNPMDHSLPGSSVH